MVIIKPKLKTLPEIISKTINSNNFLLIKADKTIIIHMKLTIKRAKRLLTPSILLTQSQQGVLERHYHQSLDLVWGKKELRMNKKPLMPIFSLIRISLLTFPLSPKIG